MPSQSVDPVDPKVFVDYESFRSLFLERTRSGALRAVVTPPVPLAAPAPSLDDDCDDDTEGRADV
jgi:hypothetical protein